MKTKLLIIFLILLISFSISCRKKIFNPSIPNSTVFIEEPIANLSIPSKDATIRVTPVESIYTNNDGTILIYNYYHHFFDFNGKHYLTSRNKCSYNSANKTLAITDSTYFDLLEIDVNDGFKMKNVKINITVDGSNPNDARIIRSFDKIVKGESYTNASRIFIIDDDGKYYSSADIINWELVGDTLPSGVSKKEPTDLYRIKIKSQSGKTYTYVYADGARTFSIERLSDRMKQLAQRLEYKFDFKEEDFNNHHMFDIGINTSGGTDIDFRLNPTNYLDNDTNYVYMGATNNIKVPQLWLMPVKKDGKDYLVRLVEHGGPELYGLLELQTDMNNYKVKAEKSLAKALALVAEGADTSLIQDSCYESIFYDANYKANKYFLDVVEDYGVTVVFSGVTYISSNRPITHYVIDIVDIQ